MSKQAKKDIETMKKDIEKMEHDIEKTKKKLKKKKEKLKKMKKKLKKHEMGNDVNKYYNALLKAANNLAYKHYGHKY